MLDLELLDDADPFEIDVQAAHLFKHPNLGMADVREAPRPQVPGGPMTDMTPEREHAFYADPDNQTPQGPAVRRRPRNAAALPIRLPAEMLEQVRQRAAADDRSVSSWVRRAIEHELSRPA